MWHIVAIAIGMFSIVRNFYCNTASIKSGIADAASNQHCTDTAAASNVPSARCHCKQVKNDVFDSLLPLLLACSAQFESFIATQQALSVALQMQSCIASIKSAIADAASNQHCTDTAFASNVASAGCHCKWVKSDVIANTQKAILPQQQETHVFPCCYCFWHVL